MLGTVSSSHHSSSPYRGDIDGLRAIAVLLVLLYHLKVPGFGGGFVGVDLFFVISGLLITKMILVASDQGSFGFRQFLIGRIYRLLPSLLVVLLLTFVGATAVLSTTDMQSFGESLIASLFFGGNFYFSAHSGYFESDAASKPLLHLWSLGVEAQFYLLWPALLLLALRVVPRRELPAAAAVLALTSAITAFVLLKAHSNAAFYWLPSRLVEFLLGALVVWIPVTASAERRTSIADGCLAGGLALIALAIVLHTKGAGFPSYQALAACLGAALILYGAENSRGNALLNNPALGFIGRISYELYLFHWPLIALLAYIEPATNITTQAVLAFATLALATLTYYAVGRPMRYAYERASRMQRLRHIFWPILGVTLLGLAGSAVAIKGWEWRLPEDNRLFITSPEKFHSTKFGGIGYQENKLLVLGDAGIQPSLIVIGDSHAGQYAAAFDEFLKEQKKSAYLYYVNACLFIPGGSAHMQGVQTKECLGAHVEFEKLLTQHPLPVVHAQSWESYQDGVYSIAADGQRVPYLTDASVNYYDTLMGTISQMKAYLGTRKYMVVGIAPGIEDQQPIARCLAAPVFFKNSCYVSAAVPEAKRTTGQTFNVKAANQFTPATGITFLNPRAVLCPDGFCYAFDGESILYSDRSHLTKDGAKKILLHYRDMILTN